MSRTTGIREAVAREVAAVEAAFPAQIDAVTALRALYRIHSAYRNTGSLVEKEYLYRKAVLFSIKHRVPIAADSKIFKEEHVPLDNDTFLANLPIDSWPRP